MRRATYWSAVVLVGSLLFVAPAWAAGDGGEGNPWKTFGWEIFNLILLIGVIVYFARKPIVAFFGRRREQIRGELSSSATLLADAEARLAEWQARMGELDAELEKIRASERQRSEREREKILEDARQAALRIRRDAGTAVEREMRRAQEELRREAAELALEMAEGLLRERIDDADQARLVDEFIARVETASAAGRTEN